LRRALETVFKHSSVEIPEEDRQIARQMLDALADFANEVSIDPRNEESDSLARDGAALDWKWKLIQDKYLDRMYQIATEGGIRESDHEMIRIVLSTAWSHAIWNMRKHMLETIIRKGG